jgi:ferrous iron transport protein B
VKVALIGSPNVGKSLIFYHLTGKYATVSNYPGTSVDVTRGKIKGLEATLIDTPGMYSFITITEEEKVAKKILFDEQPDVVVHVMDAKNIERKLPLTLQLIDSCFNTVLVLNAMDEAKRLGMQIDVDLLRERLGIPVVETIATQKKGIRQLKEIIESFRGNEKAELIYFNEGIQNLIKDITSMIESSYPVRKQFLAQLLLMGDADAVEMIRKEKKFEEIIEYVKKASLRYPHSLSYEMALQIEKSSSKILSGIVSYVLPEKGSLVEKLGELTIHPVFAIPMAIAAILALYFFAGVIGAQILVDFLETFFEDNINIPLNSALEVYVPNYWLRELIGGEFGIITLGLRYAFAIILPIVTIFFFIFSIIEDSGYLPRLAILMDRLFKVVGLSGKAVIPLVLGLGCGTMATIVTKVLETRKEKIIATVMLAVGIPCSAQLGVIFSIAPDITSMIIWVSIITVVLLIAGYLASKMIKEPEPVFLIEIPTLRVPELGNVVTKTITRLEWYFKEVIPVFVVASLFIWVGRITGVFDMLVSLLTIPAGVIGLPEEAAIVFLFGFFRRDYGAAGLFDLADKGLLSVSQIIVAMVTLTLFVPCVAQFLVMVKERGMKVAILIFVTSVIIAFGVGYLTSIGLVFTNLV